MGFGIAELTNPYFLKFRISKPLIFEIPEVTLLRNKNMYLITERTQYVLYVNISTKSTMSYVDFGLNSTVVKTTVLIPSLSYKNMNLYLTVYTVYTTCNIYVFIRMKHFLKMTCDRVSLYNIHANIHLKGPFWWN